MNTDDARLAGMHYAWGREDASGAETAGEHPYRSGWSLFADAYAQGWADYNAQRRCSMTNNRDAYDRWQESGGRSIFRRGDLTLTDEQRAELRALWPTFWSKGSATTTAAYYARQQEFQDAAWAAAGPARTEVTS